MTDEPSVAIIDRVYAEERERILELRDRTNGPEVPMLAARAVARRLGMSIDRVLAVAMREVHS